MTKQQHIDQYLDKINQDLSIFTYLDLQRDELDARISANIKALNKLDPTAFDRYMTQMESKEEELLGA